MLLKIVYAALCLVVFSCSGIKRVSSDSNGGSRSSEINIKVKKITLDNGLRVLIVENHKLPIFSYYTFFNIGGRHEGKGTTGASHFLEHMMFKGAKKYGPGKFDHLIESSGGSNNAYTTFDNTVYYESLPSNKLNLLIDMEADRMSNLLLEEKAFESERNVVFEERKIRYENSDRGKIYLKMMKTVFKGTPYGGSVIGDVKDLKELSRERMRGFFKNFYTPDNAIIAIAGDIDTENTIKLIRQRFGPLKSSTKKTQEYKKGKDALERYAQRASFGKTIRLRGSSPTPNFIAAYPGNPIGTREGFVLDILSSILGTGDSSYLIQKYVKGRRPVLNGLYAYNNTLKFNGVFHLGGTLLPKVNLSRFQRRLHKDLIESCNEAITARSLQKTKNQYNIQYYSDIQTNAGVAEFLGLRELYFDDYRFYKKERNIYNSITVEEVKASCKKLFKNNKPTFLSIWNKHPRKGKK